MKAFLTRLFWPLIVIMLGTSGCDLQDGQFVTTGDTLNPLLSPVGSIDIVDGYERKADLINDQHLLYILILTPAVQEHGSGSSSTYDKYVTTLSHTWNTEKGTFNVSISWDRQKDVVMIGNQQFTRSQGDVFVVQLNADGAISGKQLANPDLHSNPQKVLQYIQHQLPEDKLVSSIQLSR